MYSTNSALVLKGFQYRCFVKKSVYTHVTFSEEKEKILFRIFSTGGQTSGVYLRPLVLTITSNERDLYEKTTAYFLKDWTV